MPHATEKFFLIRVVGELLEFLRTGVTKLHPDVIGAGEVFETNLMDVFVTASLPYLTTCRAVQEMGAKSNQVDSEHSEADIIGTDTAVRVLSKFLEIQGARFAANALLHGCTVLAWSAFEILATDLFEQLVNSRPALTKVLFADERTKKFYERRDLMNALETYQYDLSSRMGTVLLERQRLDKLAVIRVVYDAMFPTDEELRGFLNSDDLWNLSRYRNLIAHRHGIVDEEFRRTTSSNATVGGVLQVTPEELESFVVSAGRAGLALLNAATTLLKQDSAKDTEALIRMGYDQLGQRLVAAVISHRLGLRSVDYALKTYVQERVNNRWIQLAADLDAEISEGLGKSDSPPSGIVT